MADAGRILIIPKGIYSTTTAYEVLDLVNHKGKCWIAKKDAIGVEPSEANSEYWFEMAGQTVANGLTTTEEGYVLDARQGKVLMDAIGSTSAELAVERARIDSFVTLPEGSTTGDAELIDARIGADGVTYANLGEANRTQFASLKSDLSKTNEDLDTLENATTYMKTTIKDTIPQNEFKDGFWWNKSANSSASYIYTDELQVKEGDIVTCVNSIDNALQACRFIEAYSADGSIVTSATTSTDTYSYTVPENVVSIRVSTYSVNKATKVMHIQTSEQEMLLKNKKDKTYLSAETDSLSANTDIVITDNFDNKKNCSYLFFGKFSNFSKLTIGHGKTEYGAVYLELDNENITIYAYNGSAYHTFAHGLTLSDFVSVSIKVADTAYARATITVTTNGGEYKAESVIFFGSNGKVFAKSETAMTDVKFTYVVSDILKDVYIFGDSYTSLADDARWTKYVIESGNNNMLISGFGGATSADQILAFRNIVALNTPKYVAWFLGMNDTDTTEVNSSWKECVEEVIAYCNANDIELILATIPNTPLMENAYKNAYVRSSGYRYVDFAKAVGAETSGSSWYDGMLHTDNVHPAISGAKALAQRVLLDLPEIIQ